MRNRKRLTTLFLILLLILGVAALITKGIYYKYENEFHGNEATSTAGIPAQPTTTTPFSNNLEEGYNKYENNVYKFSILYSSSLKRVDAASVGNIDGLDSKNIFIGEIPKDTFAGSNLRSVHIIAGAKRIEKDSCRYEIYGNSAKTGGSNYDIDEVKMKDIEFTKIEFGEGAAGSFYHTTKYSTYKDGICYEMLAVATSPNPPDYKKSIYLDEFEEIVSFFSF